MAEYAMSIRRNGPHDVYVIITRWGEQNPWYDFAVMFQEHDATALLKKLQSPEMEALWMKLREAEARRQQEERQARADSETARADFETKRRRRR